MSFLKYPHLERLGSIEVEGIEFGTCHVFPKLDGTNASMWRYNSGHHGFGSRNRVLSIANDNAGFMNAMLTEGSSNPGCFELLHKHKKLRLYGEWLVPHTLKGYRDDAWRKFYVFDVYDDEKERFLTYDEYKPWMEQYQIDYIPCIKVVKNGTPDMFSHEVQHARFLLKDDCPAGEGIVIKNYAWENKYKRQTWAKIIGGEFKDQFHKVWEPSEVKGECNEEILVDAVVTKQLVDKEYAKIVVSEDGWSSKYIPRLLETVFYCVVTEELYDGWKKVKYGTINGKSLRNFTNQRIKQLKPELF
jgi:hypothetical protein